MKILVSTLISLLILAVIIWGGYYLFTKYKTQISSTARQTQIDIVYSGLSTCEANDDCILSDIKPYCGCEFIINKHTKPQDLEDAVEAHRQSGEKCMVQTQCLPPPTQEEIQCVSGRCEVVRPTVDPAKTLSDDPKILEDQIKNRLSNANYCATDDNCVVADIDAQCPIGCYWLVSKNADLSNIKEGLEKYRSTTGECVMKCAAPPELTDIQCNNNNKCVDRRNEKYERF